MYCCGCQSESEKIDASFYSIDTIPIDSGSSEKGHPIPEPISCIDWIGYYGESIRQLDSVVEMIAVKTKVEGPDEFGSANKLKAVYVLMDKDVPILKIGELAKYLAYKLCLSNDTRLKGVLMDCQKRKIQVAIARHEKNYLNEAWAVMYNVFPANKKGELHTLDFIK